MFVKFSKYNAGTSSWGPWTHATLDTTIPTGQPADLTIDVAQTDGAGKGAFLYRTAAASGTASWAAAKLRWKYGTDGVLESDNVKFQVYGVEMVYVPEGSFAVGDDDASTDENDFNSFYTFGCAVAPCAYTLASAGAITLGTTNGDLYYRSTFFFLGGDLQNATIPAEFPKGYNAFYMMKYELSQAQYRDFLNSLTRVQQNIRVESAIASGVTSITGVYVMTETATVQGRNGIRSPGTFSATAAITFGCDLDGDGTFNESNDGEWIAANYLSWDDLLAYADWAALRPMTEFEFEKAARGPSSPVADEFPWGDATPGSAPSSVASGGQTAELPNQGRMNFNYNAVAGPVRTGAFATAATARDTAGAGYYGVLELAGNLAERMFTPTTALGRAFAGALGNGVLDVDGNADASHWRDAIGADGFGPMAIRGGSWAEFETQARVGDRYWGVDGTYARTQDIGGRLVR